MAECIIVGNGAGGVSSDELSAKAEWVLKGCTYVGSDTDDDIGTGTMVNNGAVTKTLTPTTSEQTYTIPLGWHNGSGKVTVSAISSDFIQFTDSSVSFDFGTISGLLGGVVPNYVQKIDGVYTETDMEVEYYDGYPLLKEPSDGDGYQLLVFKNPIHLSLLSKIQTTYGRSGPGGHGIRFLKLDKTGYAGGYVGSSSGTSTEDLVKDCERNEQWTEEWVFLAYICNNDSTFYLKNVGFTLL